MQIDQVRINGRDKPRVEGEHYLFLLVRLNGAPVPKNGTGEGATYLVTWNDEPVRHHPVSRPDLPANIQWLCVYVDLTRDAARASNELSVAAVPANKSRTNAMAGLAEASARFIGRKGAGSHARTSVEIAPDTVAALPDIAKAVARKRERIGTILERDLKPAETGAYFSINANEQNPSVSDKRDPVSAHQYPPRFHEIMREIGPDGLALDLGAGFRSRSIENVVALEIFDYPSTDVVSFGKRTPFKDASFDFVYTNAVLEHVDNPFEVAAEIQRVLKPGGYLYSGLPFMQAEHGYPFHFFNATRMGHRKLFEGMDVLDHEVGPQGHPWYVVMRSLGLFRTGLTGERRRKFDELTVGEILGRSYGDWKKSEFADLPEDVQWKLAGSTVMVARKPK